MKLKTINLENYDQHFPSKWPDDDDFWVPDYDDILKSFGFEILVQIDDDGYQGDSRLLFQSEGTYGFLIFGWGSCSGCDTLQACNSKQEVLELRNELLNNIKWFELPKQLLAYLKSENRKGDFYYDYEESSLWHEFVKECEGKLNKIYLG